MTVGPLWVSELFNTYDSFQQHSSGGRDCTLVSANKGCLIAQLTVIERDYTKILQYLKIKNLPPLIGIQEE